MATSTCARSRRVLPHSWPFLAEIARALSKATPSIDGAVVPKVPAEELRTIGQQLLSVAYGEDARVVFEQVAQRGNQSNSTMEFNRAISYWRVRAEKPSAPDATAVAAARDRYPDPPSDERIRRIARKYREHALDALEAWSFQKMSNGKVLRERRGIDASALREYLRKRSPR